jgi:hypothetical protein
MEKSKESGKCTMPDKEGIFISGVCVRGARHIQADEPCQDAWQSEDLTDGSIVVVVADGLSSAPHAQEGAMIVVSEVCRTFMSADPARFSGLEDLIRFSAEKARQKVLTAATKARVHPSSFASTLIITHYNGKTLTVGHIGDGLVAGTHADLSFIISPPGQSEYANETACLTQADWETQFRVVRCPHADACIITTDGCQGAVSIKKGTEYKPYEPFVNPLITFTRKKRESGEDPSSDIKKLLISPRMQDLSGDDKTLIILLGSGRMPGKK